MCSAMPCSNSGHEQAELTNCNEFRAKHLRMTNPKTAYQIQIFFMQWNRAQFSQQPVCRKRNRPQLGRLVLPINLSFCAAKRQLKHNPSTITRFLVCENYKISNKTQSAIRTFHTDPNVKFCQPLYVRRNGIKKPVVHFVQKAVIICFHRFYEYFSI